MNQSDSITETEALRRLNIRPTFENRAWLKNKVRFHLRWHGKKACRGYTPEDIAHLGLELEALRRILKDTAIDRAGPS